MASSNSGVTENVAQLTAEEWVCVGHRSTLGARTALKVHSRQVTLLRLRPKASRLRPRQASTEPSDSDEVKSTSENREIWTCLDSICYHAGGPLLQGELRTVAGRTCVECPWHHYLIDVLTGEGLYMDISRKYQSKGVRQRLHRVEIRDDHVYIKLDQSGDLPSDEYAYTGKNWSAGGEVDVKCFPDW